MLWCTFFCFPPVFFQLRYGLESFSRCLEVTWLFPQVSNNVNERAIECKGPSKPAWGSVVLQNPSSRSCSPCGMSRLRWGIMEAVPRHCSYSCSALKHANTSENMLMFYCVIPPRFLVWNLSCSLTPQGRNNSCSWSWNKIKQVHEIVCRA